MENLEYFGHPGLKKTFFQECDDVSDEKNCQTIYIDPQKYLKSKPPPSAEINGRLPVTLRLV